MTDESAGTTFADTFKEIAQRAAELLPAMEKEEAELSERLVALRRQIAACKRMLSRGGHPSYTANGPQLAPGTPLSICDLSVRSGNSCAEISVTTIAQLASKRTVDLLRTRNFGQKCLNECRSLLARAGLRFADEQETTEKP